MYLNINQVSFQSKINKNVAEKTTALVTAAVAASTDAAAVACSSAENNSDDNLPGLQAIGSSNIAMVKMKRTREDITAKQNWIEKKIKNVMNRAIKKQETRTLEDIAKRTKLSLSQVTTAIYRSQNPEIRDLFDRVKDTKTIKKEMPYEIYELALKTTGDAAKYNTNSETFIPPEADYINYLSAKMHNAVKNSHWTPEVLETFVDYFKTAPAFADILISTQNKNKIVRAFSNPDSLVRLFEANSLNSELTEQLVTEISDDGNFKYRSSQIGKIVWVVSMYPELSDLVKKDTIKIYKLARMQDENNNYRFWGEEIKTLYEYLQKYPELTAGLISDKVYIKKDLPDDDDETKKVKAKSVECNDDTNLSAEIEKKEKDGIFVPKYTGAEIISIIKMYESEPKLILSAIKERYCEFQFVQELVDYKAVATKDGNYWEYTFSDGTKVTNSKELKARNIPEKCWKENGYYIQNSFCRNLYKY